MLLSFSLCSQREFFKIEEYPEGNYATIFDLMNKKPTTLDSLYYEAIKLNRMADPMFPNQDDHVHFYIKSTNKKVKGGYAAIKHKGQLYINESSLLYYLKGANEEENRTRHYTPSGYHRVLVDGRALYIELKFGVSSGTRALNMRYFGLLGGLQKEMIFKSGHCGILFDPRERNAWSITDCESFNYAMGMYGFSSKLDCKADKSYDIYKVRDIVVKELKRE